MGRANWLYFLGTKSNKCELFVYGISLPTSSGFCFSHKHDLGKIGDKRLYAFESVTNDINIPNISNNVVQLNIYHKDLNKDVFIVYKNKYIQSNEPDDVRIESPIGQTVYVNSYYSLEFYNFNNGMFLKEENKELLLLILSKMEQDSGQHFNESYFQRLGCFEYIEAMPWAETSAPFTISASRDFPNKYSIKRDKEYLKEKVFVHLIVYSKHNDVLLDEFKIFKENTCELQFDTEIYNDTKYKYSIFDSQGKLIYKDSGYWMLGLSLQMNIISDTVKINSADGIKTISAYTPTKPIDIQYPANQIIQDIDSNINIIKNIKKSQNINLRESFPQQKWFDKNENTIQEIFNFIKEHLQYNAQILIVDPFISPESLELLMNINNTSISINIISCWGNNDPDSNDKSSTKEIIEKTKALIKKFANTSFPVGKLVWYNLSKDNFHDRFIYISSQKEDKIFLLSNSINNLLKHYNFVISELKGITKEKAIKYINNIKTNCREMNRIFPEVENV